MFLIVKSNFACWAASGAPSASADTTAMQHADCGMKVVRSIWLLLRGPRAGRERDFGAPRRLPPAEHRDPLARALGEDHHHREHEERGNHRVEPVVEHHPGGGGGALRAR